MNNFLANYVNTAFHFNTWRLAPDHQKDSLEDRYFPLLKIKQETENRWTLRSGGTDLYVIEMTEGSDLTELGTLWTITASNFYFYYNPDPYPYYTSQLFSTVQLKFVIEHQSPNEWHVSTGPYQLDIANINVILKNRDTTPATDILKNNFDIYPTGILSYHADYYSNVKEKVELYFKTIEPLSAKLFANNAHCLHWSRGKIALEAYSEEKYWSADITVKDCDKDNYTININYLGVDETWEFPESYEYVYSDYGE